MFVLRNPFDSILEAVLTVSPNKQYLGIFRPTTPATTGPATTRVMYFTPGSKRYNCLVCAVSLQPLFSISDNSDHTNYDRTQTLLRLDFKERCCCKVFPVYLSSTKYFGATRIVVEQINCLLKVEVVFYHKEPFSITTWLSS